MQVARRRQPVRQLTHHAAGLRSPQLFENIGDRLNGRNVEHDRMTLRGLRERRVGKQHGAEQIGAT
jgi:hypothetical protein